ncbi:MAG: metallophosphoesterase [archaeon]
MAEKAPLPQSLEIHPGITLLDLGVIVDSKTMVISDTHVGYEESLQKQGVLLPRFQLKDMLDRLEAMIEVARPETIVISGDVKDEFGTISDTEWRDTLHLLDFLSERCKRLVLVKGNHDTILDPIARRADVEIMESFTVGDVFICHGDRILESDAPIIIIGHQHPAVTLSQGGRTEKYKCFLWGKHKKSRLLVLPSFHPITEGQDLFTGKVFSPYLKKGFARFSVYVAGREILDFGKASGLAKLT